MKNKTKKIAQEAMRWGMEKPRGNVFIQGFACAVAALIIMDRQVETATRELFGSGLGKYDLKKFREWGIDEYDINVFKKYRKQLL